MKVTGMDAHRHDTQLRRYALAIDIWENEGGAPALGALEHQYAKNIETERTWTRVSPAYEPMSGAHDEGA